MKRDDAKKMMRDVLTGHHEICTHNHYSDADKAMDIIYDSFKMKGISILLHPLICSLLSSITTIVMVEFVFKGN